MTTVKRMVEDFADDFAWEPYPKYPRGVERKKPGDLWQGLEAVSSGAAIMSVWEWACGSAVECIEPFLRNTGKRADAIACPGRTPCGCVHVVRETDRYGWIAACSCEEWPCETYLLEPGDVFIHALDRQAFGVAVARVLGFGAAEAVPYAGQALFEIGRCAPAAAPVYLGLGDSDAVLRDMGKLAGLREGPFVLLTPTGKACDAHVEQALRQYGAAHISLSSVLVECRVETATSPQPSPPEAERVTGASPFRPSGMLQPMLAGLMERLAKPGRNGELLSSIHREIAAVRGEFVEVRSAKQRLEKMLADGLFAFTQKVDAHSFKVLCTILAEGDVAKAGRKLQVPEATVRAVVKRWGTRGKEFGVMQDLVRWRKAVGRKETVRLNDAIIHERAATVDYPGLLSDVLDGLMSMTDENWAERCEGLTEMLRAACAGYGR